MASVSLITQDPFLAQVEEVRGEIRSDFARTHQVLVEREAALISELDQLAARYKGKEITEQIREIIASKEQLVATMKGNENKETLDHCTASLESRQRKLEYDLESTARRLGSIVFQWDIDLEIIASKVGVIQVSPSTNYKKRGNPLMVAPCENKSTQSRVNGVFFLPKSIAFDSGTNQVFVCDGGNNRVQVFTKSFEFEFEFNKKMNLPEGICINRDLVYVVQLWNHSLNVYSTKGKLFQSVGSEGKKALEFKDPTSVAVSNMFNLIYVCDKNNNRIQILTMKLTFHSYISHVTRPQDIKLTSDGIIVLKHGDKCISIYNYIHELLREIIPCGKGLKVLEPGSFCLDLQCNILMTDYAGHCVSIFSPTGELMHTFGKKGNGRGEFINPTGIVLDSEHRIIVTSENPKHCIQLF